MATNYESETMSEYGKLAVQVRSAHGKGPARRLRQEGKIPGVMYGGGKGNLSLTVDPRLLTRAMNPKLRYNTLFSLTVQQEGKADVAENCVIADYDMDAVRDELLHVEFVRVDPSGEIERKIPVVYKGRAAGMALGGKLETFRRTIRVAAPAGSIPEELVVDITALEAGQYVRIKDVSLDGARILEPAEHALAFVAPPKEEKDEDADEGPSESAKQDEQT